MHPAQRAKRRVATVAVLSLLVESVAPVLVSAGAGQAPTPAASQPATAKPAATQPPAKPAPTPAAAPAGAKPQTTGAKPQTTAAAAPAVDGGWPRVYDVATGGAILVYQPQIASWADQKKLVVFSAVSYRAKGAEKSQNGTVKLEADTKVAVAERLVSFKPIKIAEANFPGMQKEDVRQITETIEKAMPDDDRVIALDRVLANVDKSTIRPKKTTEGIKADPPTIFFSKTPAVIVNIDGDPIWSPIKDVDLKYAVNTNWDLFEHTPTTTFYLRNNDSWLKASKVEGPWTAAGKLPPSFSKLPAEENWKDVKANLPGRSAKPPAVFVSNKPAELILLRGEPSYLLVQGTSSLLWVSNTDSDIFRLGKAGPVYYLVAGRWFSAPDFTGPWTFATPTLPEEFKKIPLEHERSRVLASVPGTDAAAEAVLLAEIPQTARVNRKQIKAPDVAYQGDKPDFKPIEQTTVQRAVNTDKDIFKVGEAYYMCYQGVWFTGKAANGPWEVATTVPQEIYKIPISSPSHHVTYVTIEEDDDDDWVVFAAAAGYTGMMIGWGCAVWGSGWYYPPYYGYGGFYPYYYPYFPTYGYSAWYNPWTGAYGRSAGVYGPYGGAGVAARYNPRTGTYARGAAAYGPYGARGVAQAYNPRTGAYAATRQGSSVYGNWGSSYVQRGDDWARTNHYTNRGTGTTTRTIRTDDGAAISRRGPGGGGFVAGGDGGNMYAGHDGNVYRRQDGTWQKWDNGGWNNTDKQPADRPTPRDGSAAGNRAGTMDRGTVDQLNRDSAARREGAQRTRDYGSYRGGSGTHGTGSYRSGGYGGGGGFRGGRGGGRRR